MPYFTAAAAIGQTENEIKLFLTKLDECYLKLKSQNPATIFKLNAELQLNKEENCDE
jgi:thymidylate kinase